MKESLKALGFALLGVSILPLAKFASKGLIKLVQMSPHPADDDFLRELAKQIIADLK